MSRVLVDVGERRPARATLVAFPPAGSGVTFLEGWGPTLAPAMNFCVVRLPGRETLWDEEPVSSMVEVLSLVLADLAGRGDEEVLLYGCCTGGLLAYELAQQMPGRGLPAPRALVLASAATPDSMTIAPMHGLPTAELKRYFDQAEQEEYPEELWEFAEPRVRADLRATEHADYTMSPLNIPIVVLRGHDDEILGRDYCQGWVRFTRSEFVFKEFTGGHFFMIPSATLVAEELIRIQQTFGQAGPGSTRD